MPDPTDKLRDDESEECRRLAPDSQPLIHICTRESGSIILLYLSVGPGPKAASRLHTALYTAYGLQLLQSLVSGILSAVAQHCRKYHSCVQQVAMAWASAEGLMSSLSLGSHQTASLHCLKNRPVQTFQCSGSFAKLV